MNDKRSVMDALDAPQWTDFTSSPQVSDDFFNRLHLEHELEYHQKMKTFPKVLVTDEDDFEDVLDQVQITPVKVLSPKAKHNKEEKVMETTVGDLLLEAMSNLELSTKKGRLNQSIANSSTDTFKTPKMPNKRVTRSMSASRNRADTESHVSAKLKMRDDEIKTPGKKINQNIKHDFTEVEMPKEKKMPSRIVTSFSNNKITHSINNENKENKSEGINTCTSKSLETKTNELSLKSHKDVDTAIEVSTKKKMRSRIVTSFSHPRITNSTNKEKTENESQGINNCTTKSSETKNKEQPLLKSQKGFEIHDNDGFTANEKKHVPSRIVTSFGSSKSNGSTKSDDATTNKKRPHLLTSKIRRHSLSKQKDNEPYVSLAEAVSKFQKGTPKRFRSVSAKELKPGPLAALKQATLKITRPISPALTCKTRIRPVKALSQEQKETTEFEKMKIRPMKANPVPRPVLKKAETIKKIEKKPATVPEPFNLSQSRKIRHFSSAESLASKQSRQTCHSSTSSLYDALNLREPVQKKMVHAIVSSEDSNLAVKEEELGHFGIPTEPCGKPKKFTRTLPFTFEKRNKEFQDKKDRKLKQIQSEEMKLKKIEFHAKPAPSTNHVSKEPGPMKGRMTPKQNSKESTATKKTTLCPFSFEERNKLLLKKKENLIKESLEKDKKAREFHANPVPEFRPVIVRGRSRENIKIEEKTPEKQKINKANKALQVAKTLPTNILAKKNIGDQENNDPKKTHKQRANSEADLDDAKSNLKLKSSVLSELNTDKRARERKEFEEKLKRKEMAEEELRRKEEEERLAREKAEIVELRRMAEIKARPMPHYKPVAIIKSSKPLTDPQSPAWVRKSKM